jgi:hypothetical protein
MAKVECGERRLDVVEAMDLCDALGVSLADVLPKNHLLASGPTPDGHAKRSGGPSI